MGTPPSRPQRVVVLHGATRRAFGRRAPLPPGLLPILVWLRAEPLRTLLPALSRRGWRGLRAGAEPLRFALASRSRRARDRLRRVAGRVRRRRTRHSGRSRWSRGRPPARAVPAARLRHGGRDQHRRDPHHVLLDAAAGDAWRDPARRPHPRRERALLVRSRMGRDPLAAPVGLVGPEPGGRERPGGAQRARQRRGQPAPARWTGRDDDADRRDAQPCLEPPGRLFLSGCVADRVAGAGYRLEDPARAGRLRDPIPCSVLGGRLPGGSAPGRRDSGGHRVHGAGRVQHERDIVRGLEVDASGGGPHVSESADGLRPYLLSRGGRAVAEAEDARSILIAEAVPIASWDRSIDALRRRVLRYVEASRLSEVTLIMGAPLLAALL